MDESNNHVRIDFDKLAASLVGKFQTLSPLSKDCCIYQVPPKIRMLNATLYTPKMVSIGPIHHDMEVLKPMQEHKLRYLQKFLQRTPVPIQDFFNSINCREKDLYNCYAETISFGREEFMEMVLLDAVFLLEMFLHGVPDEFQSHVDRIFAKPGKIKDIVLDILLLENQLPIFILQELFNVAWPGKYILQPPPPQPDADPRQPDSEAVPNVTPDADPRQPDSEAVPNVTPDANPRQQDSEAVPNVTKLHQAGVKFKVVESKNLFEITFNKGTLEIPKLTIGNMTIHLLRNLQIYEGLHSEASPSDINYMNDYNVILNRLLNTSKDVELLIHKGVIDNQILDSEGVSTLFGELSRDATANDSNFYYSGLVKDLQDYCKSSHHKWMATLKQNYFNTPWKIISIVVAVIILVLTFIQTVFSGIGH